MLLIYMREFDYSHLANVLEYAYAIGYSVVEVPMSTAFQDEICLIDPRNSDLE